MRHQIAAFHQFDAHLAGQKRVFEISRVVDARRQQHDGRLGDALRRQRPQSCQQRLAVMLDRLDAALPEQIRENTFHHLAADQHVADAARNAQIIFQHHKFAGRHADQVGAGDGDVGILADDQPAHLAAKMFAAINQFLRHHAVFEDATFVIQVF